MPPAVPVRNVVFRIRIEHLPHQGVDGQRTTGVKVDHPQAKARHFPDQGLPHAPQNGSRQGPRSVDIEDLRAARHEPDASLWLRTCIRHALQQCQGTPGSVLNRARQRGRGRIRIPVGQGTEMDNTKQRFGTWQNLEQTPPGIAHRGIQRNVAGGRNRLRASRPGFMVDRNHAVAAAQQGIGQSPCRWSGLPVQDPYTELVWRSIRHPCQNHGRTKRFLIVRPLRPQNGNLAEPDIPQGTPPYGLGCHGVVAAIAVAKPPEPIQQPERDVLPPPPLGVLQGHQNTPRRQQTAAMMQRFVQPAGGMQHVGRNHRVVCLQLEALGGGILLDVKGPIGNRLVQIDKAPLGGGEEAGGHVGEDILKAVCRQIGEHGRS